MQQSKGWECMSKNVSRLEKLSAEIRNDKTLWEKMDYPNVGTVLLIEESYYDGIVEDVEKLQEQIIQLKKEKEQVYHEGYKQGRFDMEMDWLNRKHEDFE